MIGQGCCPRRQLSRWSACLTITRIRFYTSRSRCGDALRRPSSLALRFAGRGSPSEGFGPHGASLPRDLLPTVA